MSLAQIGEFSFIIAGLAVASGASEILYSLAVAVSALTTLSTPWLVQTSASAARALDSRIPSRVRVPIVPCSADAVPEPLPRSTASAQP